MSSHDINIRPATPDDAAIILDLIRDLAAYEKLEHEAVGTAAQLRDHLAGKKAHALVAEVNGAPCGFALYFYNYSTFLTRPGIYLEDLYVRPEARGYGLGKALLRALAGIAVAEGCGRFEWSVLDWNEPAINVYKKIGARPMEGWDVYRLDGAALAAFAVGE